MTTRHTNWLLAPTTCYPPPYYWNRLSATRENESSFMLLKWMWTKVYVYAADLSRLEWIRALLKISLNGKLLCTLDTKLGVTNLNVGNILGFDFSPRSAWIGNLWAKVEFRRLDLNFDICLLGEDWINDEKNQRQYYCRRSIHLINKVSIGTCVPHAKLFVLRLHWY